MSADTDTEPERRPPKSIVWIASSKKDSKQFPPEVQRNFGQALFDAQTCDKHPDAKPLKGFGGAGVLEIVDAFDGNAFRAVYTVKFAGVVYVLHAFQKKSKSGIGTPHEEMTKIATRLKEAEIRHAERTAEEKRKKATGG